MSLVLASVLTEFGFTMTSSEPFERHSTFSCLHSRNNIFFASGAYRPGTSEGDRLLAHELAHVVQQSGGAAGGRVFVQRFEELKVRGNLVHSTVEEKPAREEP